MSIQKTISSIILVLLGSLAIYIFAVDAPAPESTLSGHSSAFSENSRHFDNESGLIYFQLTTGGASTTAPLPWIVVFHGIGATPDSLLGLFEDVQFQSHVYFTQGINSFSNGYEWFGAPPDKQSAYATGIVDASRRISILLQNLAQESRNKDKPIVTGFSQGGILSFALAAYYPDRLRASLPLSGWLPVAARPEGRLSGNIPVFAFHGARDRTIPLEDAQTSIDALRSAGMNITLSVYDNLDHQISAQMKQDWLEALRGILSE